MSYLFKVLGPLPPQTWPWPCSKPEVERLLAEILAIVEPALAEAAATVDRPCTFAPADELQRFLSVYAERPLTENRHGSGFNDSLWLWLAVRWLAPDLLIESGSFMGHSAWLFRRALPEARIETHDVELPRAGRLRAPGVVYRLQDWAETEIGPFDPERALCFFDDHISHGLRLRQAAERGFRYVLLDDNFPAWQLHATGAPPLPSLAMLQDPAWMSGKLAGKVEWQRNRKQYGYDEKDDPEAGQFTAVPLDLVSYRFPDLAPATRLPPGSNLTLVRLSQGNTGRDA